MLSANALHGIDAVEEILKYVLGFQFAWFAHSRVRRALASALVPGTVSSLMITLDGNATTYRFDTNDSAWIFLVLCIFGLVLFVLYESWVYLHRNRKYVRVRKDPEPDVPGTIPFEGDSYDTFFDENMVVSKTKQLVFEVALLIVNSVWAYWIGGSGTYNFAAAMGAERGVSGQSATNADVDAPEWHVLSMVLISLIVLLPLYLGASFLRTSTSTARFADLCATFFLEQFFFYQYASALGYWAAFSLVPYVACAMARDHAACTSENWHVYEKRVWLRFAAVLVICVSCFLAHLVIAFLVPPSDLARQTDKSKYVKTDRNSKIVGRLAATYVKKSFCFVQCYYWPVWFVFCGLFAPVPGSSTSYPARLVLETLLLTTLVSAATFVVEFVWDRNVDKKMYVPDLKGFYERFSPSSRLYRSDVYPFLSIISFSVAYVLATSVSTAFSKDVGWVEAYPMDLGRIAGTQFGLVCAYSVLVYVLFVFRMLW